MNVHQFIPWVRAERPRGRRGDSCDSGRLGLGRRGRRRLAGLLTPGSLIPLSQPPRGRAVRTDGPGGQTRYVTRGRRIAPLVGAEGVKCASWSCVCIYVGGEMKGNWDRPAT